MLITERDARRMRHTSQPANSLIRTQPRVQNTFQTLGKTLRAAGSPTAWACFALVGYVFVLAVLNIARYGLER